MPQGNSEFWEITYQEGANVISEAAGLVRAIVTPQKPGESVKALIWRAARATGLSSRRVARIWYGEARSIRAEEMDALRKAASKRTAVAVEVGGTSGDDAERTEFIKRLEERLGSLEGKLVVLLDEIRALTRAR